jgi:hypothetical protein
MLERVKIKFQFVVFFSKLKIRIVVLIGLIKLYCTEFLCGIERSVDRGSAGNWNSSQLKGTVS